MGGQGIDMLVPTLLELGTEEQKQKYIKPTLHGEIIWCQGYSEPNAGSDLASLQTKGELIDENWVINGQKIFWNYQIGTKYLLRLRGQELILCYPF